MAFTCGSLQSRVGDCGVVQGHSAGVRLWSAAGGGGGGWIRHQFGFSLHKYIHTKTLKLLPS